MKSASLILCAASLWISACASRPSASAATTTHTLLTWGNGAPRLKVDVPASFSLSRQEGPDFDVFHFSAESSESRIGVYLGRNPGLLSSQAGVTVQRHPGRVGGVPVEWLRWSEDGRQRSEALVAGFFGQSKQKDSAGLAIHIFVGATSQLDVAHLEAAAATLRLEEER